MFFDPMYFIFIIPGLVMAMWASWKTKSTFKKYSEYAASSRVTGAEAARMLLDNAGVHDVSIEQVGGFLSDHYDPMHKVLRLSPDVYGSHSLSAIGVACHEAGHAMQHADGYVWLNMRSAMVPMVNIGSNFSYIVMMIGMFLHNPLFIYAGIGLFSIAVLFSIVTLPVGSRGNCGRSRSCRCRCCAQCGVFDLPCRSGIFGDDTALLSLARRSSRRTKR